MIMKYSVGTQWKYTGGTGYYEVWEVTGKLADHGYHMKLIDASGQARSEIGKTSVAFDGSFLDRHMVEVAPPLLCPKCDQAEVLSGDYLCEECRFGVPIAQQDRAVPS
jgi:hypothetical protein